MPDPAVSVLLPVHNAERYLGEALDSVLAQSFTDFELIVLDDGSTDASPGIIAERRDPRIRVLRFPERRYLVAALNEGLAAARGRYAARMDADDICLPERLGRQVAFLDSNPGIAAAGCAVRVIDARGTPGVNLYYPDDPGLFKWCLCFYSPMAHPAAMMRREAVLAAGGYGSEAIRGRESQGAQDYDLWTRLALRHSLTNLAEPLLLYRTHSDSVTQTQREGVSENFLRINRAYLQALLGEAPPLEFLSAFHSRNFPDWRGAARGCELVLRLHRLLAAPGLMGAAAGRQASASAAAAIGAMLRRRAHHPALWGLAFRALALDPLAPASFLKRKAAVS